jgi:hypothetical protein
MKVRVHKGRARFAAALALVFGLVNTAWATRPMTVEDANVADVGEVELSTWLARDGDRSRVWNNSLEVGVLQGVQLAAEWARNTSAHYNTAQLGIKLAVTPTVERSCWLAATASLAHADHGGGQGHAFGGALSCQWQRWTLHTNLGGEREPGERTVGAWGVALERPFGSVTAHVEMFGQRHASPTVQAGLRTKLAKGMQLDGSWGRAERRAVFSVGLTFSF